jgi:hypothetical protein
MNTCIKTLSLIILFFIAEACYAQLYPTDYFRAPMDTPLYLSAPFGSLRDNHFHSGMDIRTYEKEGLPIYAIADGYVVRIKISPIGYGKAVYINHPNGYTSVYGHLQKFEGKLAAYIKNYQYQIKRFDFDHFPEAEKILVKKGEIIGYSGNSGTSSGPHLHFEIRDTKTEEPINPLLFGITAVDSLPPFINRVAFYDLTPNRPLLLSSETISTKNTLVTDSGWVLLDTIKLNTTHVGIGIETYDYLVHKNKEYSVYCADLFADGKKQFSYRMDRINFADTKYINAHIDYEVYKNFGYRINKCFLDDGNNINIYPYMRNKGNLSMEVGQYKIVQFCAGDIYGQTFTLHVVMYCNAVSNYTETPCNPVTWYPNKNNQLNTSSIQLTVPKGALYDTLYPCLNFDLARVKKGLSPVFQIHQPSTPIHAPITISIKPDSVSYTNKLLLGLVTEQGTIKPAGGDFLNGWVTHKTSTFGSYMVIADSIAPQVKVLNLSKKNELTDTTKFNIKVDDLTSGIDTYQGYLNGQWILLEYDPKNDLLTYFFDEQTLFNQKQELQLIVKDKKGNTTTLKQVINLLK